MSGGDKEQLARELYHALASGDRELLEWLLHPDFVGQTTEGLPTGLGGRYVGRDEMRKRFWGTIARHYVARAEPAECRLLDDGRLFVRGRYVGHARHGGGELNAEFIHVLSFTDGQVSRLDQLTDSARWAAALDGAQATKDPVARRELSVIELSVDDGLAILRVNRPEARNAIHAVLAHDILEAALRLAETSGLRAVVLLGAGPVFSVGGDLEAFADTPAAELPSLLQSMTTPYHDALRILSELAIPVVCAVQGAAAGGGLGLLHVADIVIAAEGTKFATGFGRLGLSGDGGSSWFLPRLVGPRRAAELYLNNRVLEAKEAVEWGLVNAVVPADELEARAMAVAKRLAAGPTVAFGEIRALLRRAWTSTLADQLVEETAALARTAATADAPAAIASFVNKSEPTFEGR